MKLVSNNKSEQPKIKKKNFIYHNIYIFFGQLSWHQFNIVSQLAKSEN